MFAKVKTQHARKPVTAIVAIILVASVFAAACQPSSQQGNLQIDRVISFPFTSNNIQAPDLTGPSIGAVTPGTPVALVGTGFSSSLDESQVSFNGIDLPVWMAGDDFAAIFVAAPLAPTSGAFSVTTPSGTASIGFALETPAEVSSPQGQTIQDLLNVIDDRFLSAAARTMVEDNLPDLSNDLANTANLKSDFQQTVNQLASREIAVTESIIQATGFLQFFRDNPRVTAASEVAPEI